MWSRLEGFGASHLSLPAGRSIGAVGLLQAKVASVEQAADAFVAYAATMINAARTYGMVSHSLWVRVPNPGEAPVAELIGVDLWMDADRMNEYYELSLGFDHLGPVFAGAPDTSVWRSAPGDWVEW